MRRHRTDNGDELMVTSGWLVPVIACAVVAITMIAQMLIYYITFDMRTFWRTEFPLVGDTWGALVTMFVLILIFALAVQWRVRGHSIVLWGAIALTSMQLVVLNSLRTTILDDVWYESVTQDERPRGEAWIPALILSEATDPAHCRPDAARCLLVEFADGTREWVAARPEVEAWRRIAIVQRQT